MQSTMLCIRVTTKLVDEKALDGVQIYSSWVAWGFILALYWFKTAFSFTWFNLVNICLRKVKLRMRWLISLRNTAWDLPKNKFQRLLKWDSFWPTLYKCLTTKGLFNLSKFSLYNRRWATVVATNQRSHSRCLSNYLKRLSIKHCYLMGSPSSINRPLEGGAFRS